MPPLTRCEVSRLVSDTRADHLERLIGSRLQLVHYGGEDTTRTRTVYLDDAQGSLAAGVLARPRRSTKVRLRSYHNAEGTWVEIKSRDGDRVSKRRFLDRRDPDALPLSLIDCGLDLRPVAVVEYERRAYELPGRQLRVTFDRNLRVGFSTRGSKLPLTSGCVVEIKAATCCAIPPWLDAVVRTAGGSVFSKSVAALSARQELRAA